MKICPLVGKSTDIYQISSAVFLFRALHLNRELFKYNNFMIPCDRNTSAPTGYNVTYLDNTYICKYTVNNWGDTLKNLLALGPWT